MTRRTSTGLSTGLRRFWRSDANRHLLRDHDGTTMAIADPSGRHPFAASGAVVVGEGHAPVVGVLLAVCQIRRARDFAVARTAGTGHRKISPPTGCDE
jgi:hypothetical protein